MSRYSSMSQVSEPSTVAEFFEQRSFRRLVAILGIGSAVALAYSAFKKHLFPSVSKSEIDLTNDVVIENTENGNEEIEPQEEEVPRRPEVTLYQVPRGFFTPAVSPFGLKLETFLRVAKIDHEVEIITSGTSDGTETSWIRVGDKEIKSSLECIKYLTNFYNVDLAAEASSSRKTAARLVDTLFESRISWGVALWRWVYDGGRSVQDVQALAPTGEWVLKKIKESVIRAANYQGMGKQSEEEVTAIVVQGLVDAAAALGKHKYFLGNSPGEVDCHAFSLLAQMVWNMPGSPFETTMKEQKTLMAYVIRMRDNYWPDWQDLIRQNKATTSAAVLQHPTASAILSPAPPTENSSPKDPSSNIADEYIPPREVVLKSEKSLSRSTTPSRSKNAGSEASVSSSTGSVDAKSSQIPHSDDANANAPTNSATSRTTLLSRPTTPTNSGGILKQSVSFKPSASPETHLEFSLPPQIQYNRPSTMAPSPQVQYVPPQTQRTLQHMQLPTYMQTPGTPLGYNGYNMNMGSPPVQHHMARNSFVQHHQYHNNQQAGAGFLNNNILPQSTQYQYDFSTPVKPTMVRDQTYYEDLHRATLAVMRPRTQESDITQGNESQTGFWQ